MRAEAIEWAPPIPSFGLDEGVKSSRRSRVTSSEPACMKAGLAAKPATAHSASQSFAARGVEVTEPAPSGSRNMSGRSALVETRSTSALFFPLNNPLPSWSCMQEQMKSETGLGTTWHEPGSEGTTRDLLQRLQQAEESLAEKDARIEALEECTAQLVERLALAEGLGKGKDHRDASTPVSTRSTSESTAWSWGRSSLRRRGTSESLGSDASITHAVPQSPSVAKSSRRPSLVKAKDPKALGEDQYATEADVDAVCRRCEKLLKSVTAVVESNEELDTRRRQSKGASSQPVRPQGQAAENSLVLIV